MKCDVYLELCNFTMLMKLGYITIIGKEQAAEMDFLRYKVK